MSKLWRIVFMGTSAFACPTLNILAQSQEQVLGVFTQPDRPKGRGLSVNESPVKIAAGRRGVPIFQPDNVNDNETVAYLQTLAPHVIVVVAYGQILSQRILDIPQRGCINVHASLLPKYRGPAPINWAIIKGEMTTGVTTILMDKGIDSGDILLQQSLDIGPQENAGDLHDRLAVLGAEVLRATISQWKDQEIIPRKQRESEASFAPLLKKGDGCLDWSKSAEALSNQVRGTNPWPGAFTLLNGKILKVLCAQNQPEKPGREPGTVLRADHDGIVVATGNGTLVLKKIQLQGRKRLAVAEFLRGKPIPRGTRLG